MEGRRVMVSESSRVLTGSYWRRVLPAWLKSSHSILAQVSDQRCLQSASSTSPMSSSEATAAETTTLTAPRQSSQLLQLLRSVLQGSVRDLRRYLAKGGTPDARILRALHDGSCHVSSEEYRGPGGVVPMSLLAICCFGSRTQQIGLLIDPGADLDSDKGSGSSLSPMCAAAAMGDIATMVKLRGKGALVDCDGFTPLKTCCAHGNMEAAKWLVDLGANVTGTALAPIMAGEMIATSAMLCAAAGGHGDMLRFLHAQGASFTAAVGGKKNTALHHVAASGHFECVKFMLACGFAVDTKDSSDKTALHSAAHTGATATIELLLDSGAYIEANDDTECAPLMYAAFSNKAEAVTLLLARGAVIRDGRAAYVGTRSGNIAALNALMTSLQWLAMSRSERLTAERLLLHSVRDKPALNAIRSLVLHMPTLVQSQTDGRNNALHTAAHQGKAVPLICALIKEGVDPTVRNDAGQTPADLAREAGHTLQASLLDRAADDKRKRDLQQQRQLTATATTTIG